MQGCCRFLCVPRRWQADIPFDSVKHFRYGIEHLFTKSSFGEAHFFRKHEVEPDHAAHQTTFARVILKLLERACNDVTKPFEGSDTWKNRNLFDERFKWHQCLFSQC